MTARREARRHRRRPVDCLLLITYKDRQGIARRLHARGLDLSDSGVRIEATDPIERNAVLYVRLEEYGLTGSACVRHCTRRGENFVIGLEFGDAARKRGREHSEDFVDYYEALQISPSAEMETIHRVYRMLVARYHPDNPETGDTEKFLLLTQAYETLSNPDRRTAYDASYQVQQTQPIPVFELKEFIGGIDGEANRRLGILCLLYNRRRVDTEDPGLSVLEFERMMSFPREHLLFTFWFLKEKGYVRSEQNGDFAITAAGADYVEENLPSHRVLYKLLRHAGASEAVESERPVTEPANPETEERAGVFM